MVNASSYFLDRARRYAEQEIILINLTGYNLDQLIKLFAAGCTLTAPKNVAFNFETFATEGFEKEK